MQRLVLLWPESMAQAFAKAAKLGQCCIANHRDVADFAIRDVTFMSGGSGGAMELGLLSNSALNPSVYWTTLLPPLFSGLALQPGVQTIAPPPLAWERRSEWGKVRSQVRSCDALFWIQLAAR